MMVDSVSASLLRLERALRIDLTENLCLVGPVSLVCRSKRNYMHDGRDGRTHNGLSLRLSSPGALFSSPFTLLPSPGARCIWAAEHHHRLTLNLCTTTFGGAAAAGTGPTPRSAPPTRTLYDADRYIEFHEVPCRYVHIDKQFHTYIYIYTAVGHVYTGSRGTINTPAPWHHLLHTKSTYSISSDAAAARLG